MEHRGLLRREVCPSGTVARDEDATANEKRTLVISQFIFNWGDAVIETEAAREFNVKDFAHIHATMEESNKILADLDTSSDGHRRLSERCKNSK